MDDELSVVTILRVLQDGMNWQYILKCWMYEQNMNEKDLRKWVLFSCRMKWGYAGMERLMRFLNIILDIPDLLLKPGFCGIILIEI